MSNSIDYYFTLISPFAMFGHKAFVEVANKHSKTINFKPMSLMGVWEISGAVPPGKRPPVRQRYRLLELQRIAEMRGLKVNLKPAFFPVDPTLADCCVSAIQASGGNPADYAFSVFQAVWSNDLNIADEGVLSTLIKDAGFDADKIIAAAKTDANTNARAQNTKEAIDADVVGAPGYVYDGEVFWGQDRIDLLDSMLSSGRAAFSSELGA